MAELFEDSDVPGGSSIVGGGAAVPGELPVEPLASGGAPEQDLGVGRGAAELPKPEAGQAARTAASAKKKIVRPDYQPLEPGENKVLSGNPPAPPSRADLTGQQRVIADLKILEPELTQAEIAARTGHSAHAVSKALSRPQVKLYMSSVLNEAGATLRKAARVISEAQDAKKVSYFSFEGKVQDTKEDIDHDIRLKAAKVSMEAHGALEDKGMQVNLYQSMTDEQLMAIRAGQARPDDFIEAAPE